MDLHSHDCPSAPFWSLDGRLACLPLPTAASAGVLTHALRGPRTPTTCRHRQREPGRRTPRGQTSSWTHTSIILPTQGWCPLPPSTAGGTEFNTPLGAWWTTTSSRCSTVRGSCLSSRRLALAPPPFLPRAFLCPSHPCCICHAARPIPPSTSPALGHASNCARPRLHRRGRALGRDGAHFHSARERIHSVVSRPKRGRRRRT